MPKLSEIKTYLRDIDFDESTHSLLPPLGKLPGTKLEERPLSAARGKLGQVRRFFAPTRPEVIKDIEQERGQTLLPEFARQEAIKREGQMGLVRFSDEGPLVDPTGFLGGLKRVGVRGVQKVAPPVFKGLKNLSTKLLEKFRGMPEKIKLGRVEEIINLTKKQGLRPVEEEMFRKSLVVEKGEVNLSKTAAKVEAQLVPLTPTPVKSPRWSGVGEDFIGDGKYGEVVYQSPIKTSAGEMHFLKSPSRGWEQNLTAQARRRLDTLSRRSIAGTITDAEATEWRSIISQQPQDFPNYFSHIRYEDMADGNTRKILETQSDLFQKGRLERELEIGPIPGPLSAKERVSKLEPYSSNDPLAHLRTFREEVKRAAKDGKDTLLIPSGETAMKIEGLGETTKFWGGSIENQIKITPDNLKVGATIYQSWYDNPSMIITDVLGEGKFRAISKNSDWGYQLSKGNNFETMMKDAGTKADILQVSETFDISGKIDTKHFVYKLNEEAIPREARKMGLEVEKVYGNIGGKPISKEAGQWWKIKIPKERIKLPVEAFGVTPLIFGEESSDEESNPNIFDKILSRFKNNE